MLHADHLGLWAIVWQWPVTLAVFCALAAQEAWRPDRTRRLGRGWRWVTNLGLYLLSHGLVATAGLYTLTVMMLMALGGPHVSAFQGVGEWGGPWAVLAGGFLVLDLTGYVIHRLSHAATPLWRLHAVHHADVDVDASTALRHHPFEALLAAWVTLALILVLGMPLWVPPAYVLTAMTAQIVQHANLRFPRRVEAVLGLLFVTPGLHRTHHAMEAVFHDTNYGTVLSVWDRLFGSFAPPLPSGDAAPALGLGVFRTARHARPYWALLMPFARWRETARDREESVV